MTQVADKPAMSRMRMLPAFRCPVIRGSRKPFRSAHAIFEKAETSREAEANVT
ncbi:hypothetical protein [Parasphingorhabdus flavimaris]|uniref:hypothetical protein n=1 Tax=Parasphingorhabdus flavimaris TaxID=266812 RepID=UPI0030021DEC